jgi:hypothetical protein
MDEALRQQIRYKNSVPEDYRLDPHKAHRELLYNQPLVRKMVEEGYKLGDLDPRDYLINPK